MGRRFILAALIAALPVLSVHAEPSVPSITKGDASDLALKAIKWARQLDEIRRKIERTEKLHQLHSENVKRMQAAKTKGENSDRILSTGLTQVQQNLDSIIKFLESIKANANPWAERDAAEHFKSIEDAVTGLQAFAGFVQDITLRKINLRGEQGQDVPFEGYIAQYFADKGSSLIRDYQKAVDENRQRGLRTIRGGCSQAMFTIRNMHPMEIATADERAKFATATGQCREALNTVSLQDIQSLAREFVTVTVQASEILRAAAEAAGADLRASIADRETLEKSNENLLLELAELRRAEEAKLVIHASAQQIIYVTLIAWVVIIAIVIVAITNIVHRMVRRPNNDNTAPANPINFVLFLDIMTVFLLTGVILVLGIAGKLDKEGLSALIGGISGYVLGRMTRRDTPEPARQS